MYRSRATSLLFVQRLQIRVAVASWISCLRRFFQLGCKAWMRYQQDALVRKLCMYSEVGVLGTGANGVVPEKASKLCSEGMASDHLRPTRDDCLSQYAGCKLNDAQRPMVLDVAGSFFAQNTSSCVMVGIAGARRPMMRRARGMATRGAEISVAEARQRVQVWKREKASWASRRGSLAPCYVGVMPPPFSVSASHGLSCTQL